MLDLTKRKENFIAHQLLTYKEFRPEIIEAYLKYDYDLFLPDGVKKKAYTTDKIEILSKRFSPNLIILARLIEALKIEENDFVLNTAVGYGYSAVVLSSMTKAVLALENNDELFSVFENNIIEYQLDNIILFKGEQAKGYPDDAPYDAVLLNEVCDSDNLEHLIKQLSNKGRLVGIEERGKIYKAFLIKKNNSEVSKEYIFNFI